MKSPSQHKFSQVPSVSIPRSKFDRSHGHKTAFDVDTLIPIFVDEALPGDTFNVNMTAFARMSTPIFPIMDNMIMTTHFFSVPIRTIWDHFQKFMGEQTDPGDSTTFLVPTITSDGGGFDEQSIYDYMGIPTKIGGLEVNALHLRAYYKCWNEWFRDQNLQDSLTEFRDDGPDLEADYVLQKRGKRHDYFTSCLPWPQKGEAIDLPLGTKAPIATDIASTGTLSIDSSVSGWRQLDTSGAVLAVGSVSSTENLQMYADLTEATAATINELRQAFQIQRLLERDARGGTRYTEIIKSHFGVISDDARLQRAEYLGGGVSNVNINPVVATSDKRADTASGLGQTGAYSTTAIRGHGFTKSFTEHCVLIGMVSVTADLTYQQGLNRMWSRQTRYDFFWPSFAHLGEQSVLNKEIYSDGSANDDLVFGYQERYGEMRYKPSIITGRFRSNAALPLDSWHLSQEFSSLPGLNAVFIRSNTPMDRILAVTTEPDFIFDSVFSMKCVRPMPLYGVPGMIDHF